MRIQKQFTFICLALMMLAVSFPATAQEKATKEECIAKSHEAAKMISEIGLDATLDKINDPEGPFVWKDSYVFCIEDETAKYLASSAVPKRILGFSMKDWTDANGKKVFQEFLNVAKSKGEGWVRYMHAKSPSDAPKSKISYIYKVPSTNVIVGAGIYE